MKTQEIQSFLNLQIHQGPVPFQTLKTEVFESFERHLIQYTGSEADEIKAFLFIPTGNMVGSLLVHHQHAGERHLGKSEVAGITGDPYQHFCPALAAKGFICLAPDSICFEDRRTNKQGFEPDEDPDLDMLQHYNAMAYRLLQGKLLMKQVIDDASIGISLLENLPQTLPGKIGVLGHSYGGNTVLFQSPFDERIAFSCSSGAACSYKNKFEHGTGIELAEVIPGFVERYDIDDLVRAISPRSLYITAGKTDKYALDAEVIYEASLPAFEHQGKSDALQLTVSPGGHPLDQARFDDIIRWFVTSFT